MNRRILIADDEELERRALRRILEDEPDLEFVEAANGVKVLEAVRRDRPALVILDIRMPGLDGIEVAERLRQESPGVSIIFLTAYDHFDYARSAVRLQVDDFLLKPASPTEVIATVRRVLSRIANREDEERSHQAAQSRLDDAIKLVAERLRQDLAMGLPDPQQILKFLDLKGLVGGLLVMAEFRSPQHGVALTNTARLAESCFSSTGRVALAEVCGEGVRVMMVGPPETGVHPLPVHMKEFREQVRTELGVTLLMGAATVTQPSLRPALLVTAAHRAATIASAANPVLIVAMERDAEPSRREDGFFTETNLSSAVSRALRLMEDRQAEDLSLNDVAGLLGMSPSHLSRQLARSTGHGFADCLAQFRIASAKKYLGNGTLSVKEVAHLVGFHDPAYFARVFRRLEGCSPAEFRHQAERLGGSP